MIAAVYARKSTDQSAVADEAKSVRRQIDHAKAYAAGKGWTAPDERIYIDDGVSGAEFANRPGFVRLMAALKPRAPFQVLIMSEESRLGREAIETAYALKQLITAGVRVFFYLEDRARTLDSPTDKIMLSLATYADELEREKARQRVTDAMQRKAKAGHVCGGRPHPPCRLSPMTCGRARNSGSPSARRSTPAAIGRIARRGTCSPALRAARSAAAGSRRRPANTASIWCISTRARRTGNAERRSAAMPWSVGWT